MRVFQHQLHWEDFHTHNTSNIRCVCVCFNPHIKQFSSSQWTLTKCLINGHSSDTIYLELASASTG